MKYKTINLNNNNMEILPPDVQLFPYYCIYSEFDGFIHRSAVWHWHDTLELGYISEGAVKIRTSNHEEIARKGDAIFLNGGVMHKFESLDHMLGTANYAQHFLPDLFAGYTGSTIYQKYVRPIIDCRNLQVLVIHPDNHRRIRMVHDVLQMIELSKEQPVGFEFQIQNTMSDFWMQLLEETRELRTEKEHYSAADERRIVVMMDYIQKNYMQNLKVSDIADAANISVRECTRCFRRCIDKSPMEYLKRCRCRIAAQLLKQTELSILEISEECGFSTGSYFAQVFQDVMGCTPKEYRNQSV